MRLPNAISISLALLISACDDHTDSDIVPTCEPVVILDEPISSDDYSVESASVAGHSLILDISYGGGCGSVEFSVTAHPAFMESNPVQSQLSIRFDDNDPCKALIRRKYCIDLQPLAQTYMDMYQTASGTVILRIPGYEPPVSYSF